MNEIRWTIDAIMDIKMEDMGIHSGFGKSEIMDTHNYNWHVNTGADMAESLVMIHYGVIDKIRKA